MCTVKREVTNTPLQALVLMNDPQFVEAARAMAGRILAGPESFDERLVDAFRLAVGRRPSGAESHVFQRLLMKQQQRFRSNPDAAAELLAVGESPSGASDDPVELASWAMLCNVLLNYDEFYMKRVSRIDQ